ncbi:MAG: hypothetical protein MJK18_02495 [Bdellovibrionales bacterium]|nr:hypothetical protein [Bdellovibrionales bacterium]
MSLKSRWIGNKIRHYYLVDWEPNDSFLSPLAVSLKGLGFKETYETLALLTAVDPSFQPGLHFYYHEKSEKDHGWQWADRFSAVFKAQVHGLREVDVGRKQSLLNREQRRKRHFNKRPNQPGRAYFVDDIVTTGSTALAAYKALNQPENFAVWSLFYRSTL